MTTHFRISLFSLCMLALVDAQFPLCTYAKTTDLKSVNSAISKLESHISIAQLQRTQYEKILKETEAKASELQHEKDKTQEAIKKINRELTVLSKQLAEEQLNIDSNKKKLSDLILTGYIIGQKTMVPYALNPNVAQTSRLLTYTKILSDTKAQTIHQLLYQLESVEKTKQSLLQKKQQLAQLTTQQTNSYKSIIQNQQQRKTIIHSIDLSLSQQQEKLKALRTQRATLEHTIQRLEHAYQPINLPKGPFGRLKGQLPWPAQGILYPYFDKKIDNSELKWRGILIKAPIGQPVRAVAYGEVVFSDWMPGYGFLIIINHGQGYMTLYGRNQTLKKKVGDIVKPNDMIAQIGQSGGFDEPALFFSIRHNVEPLDPVDWCRGST